MSRVPAADESAFPTWFHQTVPDPRTLLARPPPDLSVQQWTSMQAAFADGGGLVGIPELIELIRRHCRVDSLLASSPPASLVARWLAFKKVVAIRSPWGHMLPLFQFDLTRATVHTGVQLVLRELNDVLSEEELALWFVTPNDWLSGDKPWMAVATKVAALQQAARADRYVALGG